MAWQLLSEAIRSAGTNPSNPNCLWCRPRASRYRLSDSLVSFMLHWCKAAVAKNGTRVVAHGVAGRGGVVMHELEIRLPGRLVHAVRSQHQARAQRRCLLGQVGALDFSSRTVPAGWSLARHDLLDMSDAVFDKVGNLSM